MPITAVAGLPARQRRLDIESDTETETARASAEADAWVLLERGAKCHAN
jgi:hypothetical protein